MATTGVHETYHHRGLVRKWPRFNVVERSATREQSNSRTFTEFILGKPSSRVRLRLGNYQPRWRRPLQHLANAFPGTAAKGKREFAPAPHPSKTGTDCHSRSVCVVYSGQRVVLDNQSPDAFSPSSPLSCSSTRRPSAASRSRSITAPRWLVSGCREEDRVPRRSLRLSYGLIGAARPLSRSGRRVPHYARRPLAHGAHAALFGRG